MNVIKIPVLASWDVNKQIGYMYIDTDELPPDDSYHFSIGFRVLEKQGNVNTKIELVCVSPVIETKYAGTLMKDEAS